MNDLAMAVAYGAMNGCKPSSVSREGIILASFIPHDIPPRIKTPVAIQLARDCYYNDRRNAPILYDYLEDELNYEECAYLRLVPYYKGQYFIDWLTDNHTKQRNRHV